MGDHFVTAGTVSNQWGLCARLSKALNWSKKLSKNEPVHYLDGRQLSNCRYRNQPVGPVCSHRKCVFLKTNKCCLPGSVFWLDGVKLLRSKGKLISCVRAVSWGLVFPCESNKFPWGRGGSFSQRRLVGCFKTEYLITIQRFVLDDTLPTPANTEHYLLSV